MTDPIKALAEAARDIVKMSPLLTMSVAMRYKVQSLLAPALAAYDAAAQPPPTDAEVEAWRRRVMVNCHLDEVMAECGNLRRALIAVGKAVGASVSDACSTEFLLRIPQEVMLVREKDRRARHVSADAIVEAALGAWDQCADNGAFVKHDFEKYLRWAVDAAQPTTGEEDGA